VRAGAVVGDEEDFHAGVEAAELADLVAGLALAAAGGVIVRSQFFEPGAGVADEDPGDLADDAGVPRSDSTPARKIAPSARLPSGHEAPKRIRRHGQHATIMPPPAHARRPFPAARLKPRPLPARHHTRHRPPRNRSRRRPAHREHTCRQQRRPVTTRTLATAQVSREPHAAKPHRLPCGRCSRSRTARDRLVVLGLPGQLLDLLVRPGHTLATHRHPLPAVSRSPERRLAGPTQALLAVGRST